MPKVSPIKYIPVDSFIRDDDGAVCIMRTKCVNGTYCCAAEGKVTEREKEGISSHSSRYLENRYAAHCDYSQIK